MFAPAVLWLLLVVPQAHSVLFTHHIERRWTNGTIPFVRGSTVTEDTWSILAAALDHWNRNTCLKFTPKNSTSQTDWVEFEESPDKCSSPQVGNMKGLQKVFVGPECDFRTLVHELGHVVGLLHEQARPDRDEFVKMDFANMQESARGLFKIETLGLSPFEYDYGSVMHYGTYSFNNDGLPTCISPVPIGVDPGPPNQTAIALSPTDIRGVNWFYEACNVERFKLQCTHSRAGLDPSKPQEYVLAGEEFKISFYGSFGFDKFEITAQLPQGATLTGPRLVPKGGIAKVDMRWNPTQLDLRGNHTFGITLHPRKELGISSVTCEYKILVVKDKFQICERRAANPFTDCHGHGKCNHGEILPCECDATHHGVYCDYRLVGACPTGSIGNGFESLTELRSMFGTYFGNEADVTIDFAQSKVGAASLRITSSSDVTGLSTKVSQGITPLVISFWARTATVVGIPLRAKARRGDVMLHEVYISKAQWWLDGRNSRVGVAPYSWYFIELKFDYDTRSTKLLIDGKPYIAAQPWPIHVPNRIMDSFDLLSPSKAAEIWFDQLTLDCNEGSFPTLTPTGTQSPTSSRTLTAIPTHTPTLTQTSTKHISQTPTPTPTVIPSHTPTPIHTARPETPTAPTPPPAAPTPPPTPPSKPPAVPSKSNNGLIIGLVVSLVVIALAALGIVLWVLWKRNQDAKRDVGAPRKPKKKKKKKRKKNKHGQDVGNDLDDDDDPTSPDWNDNLGGGRRPMRDPTGSPLQAARTLSSGSPLSPPTIKLPDNTKFRPYKPDTRAIIPPIDNPPINQPSKPPGFPGYLPISPALGTIAAYVYPSNAQIHGGSESAQVARLRPYKRYPTVLPKSTVADSTIRDRPTDEEEEEEEEDQQPQDAGKTITKPATAATSPSPATYFTAPSATVTTNHMSTVTPGLNPATVARGSGYGFNSNYHAQYSSEDDTGSPVSSSRLPPSRKKRTQLGGTSYYGAPPMHSYSSSSSHSSVPPYQPLAPPTVLPTYKPTGWGGRGGGTVRISPVHQVAGGGPTTTQLQVPWPEVERPYEIRPQEVFLNTSGWEDDSLATEDVDVVVDDGM
eukprot:TRINITY_DN67242_c3_g13_i1.p1 TRINITY_DN67242_c3_g13~~TRINITY_DN67242_c3_g13_i1.p1  ORF type:complete len:1075 (+),score=80.39 TRINITY_DN67242_c3_g13_i1:42-3266(+)